MELAGEKKLRENVGTPHSHEVVKITDQVYFLNYFGTSNAILLVGDTSCILIDAFETDAYAEDAKKEIEKVTDKPVKTIIFTHQHGDHTGGAGAFADTVERVIAHTSSVITYGKTNLLSEILKERITKQFGYQLTLEEALSSGLGPMMPQRGEMRRMAITEWIAESKAELNIDGIELVLLAAEGETDDQQFVWLPKENVVCCGDNYYASWPNLYAIRGTQYRDVSIWVNSLDQLLALHAEVVLPGHGDALIGADKVTEVIKPYRDGINYVLEETLKGMNEGLTPDELVNAIKLPAELADLPQLQEYYGTIEWSIRGIYGGYFGWFDGNPTHLGTMNVKEKADKTIAMMGGAGNILREIADAVAKEDMQWAAELCDILLNAQVEVEAAKAYKKQALNYLGHATTSANGRHYYLSVAKDM
ncbi:MAG: alkyl/aryl-sulfatase [Peptococcaceae bacterium]|nr:alkyl/aryl-sulfatase [Peptococcaceae bacterium]